MKILALNAGSSTLKYKVIDSVSEDVLLDGSEEHSGVDNLDSALANLLAQAHPFGIEAVGHRIVHGGPLFSKPTRIDSDLIAALQTLRDLDPLHNPLEVSLIESTQRLLPGLPSVAVFDTAFHSTMPRIATLYAIPKQISAECDIRRYGFHGISYQYVSQVLIDRLGRGPENTKLILCHLGSGASVCAVRDGRSVDTSMGLTPLEGLVMGTRCGDIDPGVLVYLLRAKRMTLSALDRMLNSESGLKGVSGRSSDMRELQTAAGEGDESSRDALELFAYRLKKYIGSYAAAMGGVDAIAFTGGIGQHSWQVREHAVSGLQFLGIAIDQKRNELASAKAELISTADSRVQIWSIPTNEELQIVRLTAACLAE